MEVTNTLISSFLAVSIIDIAVREYRIRRDSKEKNKAIDKITLSNEDCIKRVNFCEKEFGDLTISMLGNKTHYDTMMDSISSRIDLMQVRLNKENMSLQSEIKEMGQDLSVQISTLNNELQGIMRSVEKVKKESQYRVVPSSELFAMENLQRQVQDLQERFNIVYEKDSVDIATLNKRGRPRKETKSNSNFDRVSAEDLLNDATPIMDWANGKLHEEKEKVSEEEEQLSEEEQLNEKTKRKVVLDKMLNEISKNYKISIPQAKVVLRFVLEKMKEIEDAKIKSQEQESNQEQQIVDEPQINETIELVENTGDLDSEVKTTTTPTRSKAIKKEVKKSLFTMKEIHEEIFRKKGMKWFTIRRTMGEEKYLHEFNKAYKRLYYYKFEATNSQNNKSTNSNEKNTTNYESIF